MIAHDEYLKLLPIWDFMRDAWVGEMAIRKYSEKKRYLYKKKEMTKEHFEFYSQCGRFPEIVSRMIRLSVDRTLYREPIGMDLLAKITDDDPEKFLNWALTETGIVGGFGAAFDLSGPPKLACYSLENIPNWSNNSIVFNDRSNIINKYGLIEESDFVEKIYYKNDDGNVHYAELQDDIEINDVMMMNRNRPLKFVPALRVASPGKPLFHGLARSSVSYYQLTALKVYILSQIVPQPVLILPDSDKEGNWDLEQLYEGGSIDYGVGKFMKLPHNSEFKIVSPVVRQVSEIRHSIALVKDEMVAQGAQRVFQRADQFSGTNEGAMRLHANDNIMVFGDVIRTVECAINRLLRMKSVLDGDVDLDDSVDLYGRDRLFQFRTIDLEDIDVASLLENEDKIAGGQVDEELAEHRILSDRIDYISDMLQDISDNQS